MTELKHGATGGGKDGKGVRTKTEVVKVKTPVNEPAPHLEDNSEEEDETIEDKTTKKEEELVI